MISNPFFLISILMSAFMTFGTMVALVENLFVLLKIEHGRVRTILRFFLM